MHKELSFIAPDKDTGVPALHTPLELREILAGEMAGLPFAVMMLVERPTFIGKVTTSSDVVFTAFNAQGMPEPESVWRLALN